MPTDPAFIRADQAIHRRFPMMAPKQRAEIVRDVLNAIREPDQAVQTVGGDRYSQGPDDAVDASLCVAFTAMIDAILIQDPGIPVVGRLVADK